MVKTIYLVRHGESEDNVAEESGGVYKGSQSLLTEQGREQARFVAKRCAELDVDVVIASTYPRARETADIINEHTAKPIEYTDVFITASEERSGSLLTLPPSEDVKKGNTARLGQPIFSNENKSL